MVLVGSSMGGWLMLLAALARPERVAGLVGIAAAPDFTDWGFDAAQKAAIRERRAARGALALWRGALRHHPRLLGERRVAEAARRRRSRSTARSGCSTASPIADVPWRMSLRLMEQPRSADVQATLIKDGDHRLSRPGDIAQLIATVEALVEAEG